MNQLERAIAAAIGEARLVAPGDRGPDPEEDVCRAPLGAPRAWCRPRGADEVAALIHLARRTGTPICVVGRRSAYWRPLRLEGAIAVDLAALDHLEDDDDRLRCGAGASVRAIDDHLRARGRGLVAHPDASGDTSIGAMVATGFTSGVGMGIADVDDLVAGLEVVLGSGEVVRTGAARSLGAPAFTRVGVPDPTGLFLAAEGALGIVTEVLLRARPLVHRAWLRARAPAGREGLERAVELAARLRIPGLVQTLRAVDPGDPRRAAPVELDVILESPLDADERDARARLVAARIREVLGAVAIDRVDEDPGEATIPRFTGAPGDAWRRTRSGRFAPVDVNLAYADAAAALRVSDAIVDDARRLPALNLRRAIYCAPSLVNLGLHFTLDAARTTDADARAFCARAAAALAALPLVPYRMGRSWGAHLAGRIDRGYLEVMRGIAAVCDPDRLLNPGVSIFGIEDPPPVSSDSFDAPPGSPEGGPVARTDPGPGGPTAGLVDPDLATPPEGPPPGGRSSRGRDGGEPAS